MFAPEEIEKMGEAAWLSLTGFSEVRYITEEETHNTSFGPSGPYKPFYRTATIFANMDPPQFKVLGLRRHLTAEEAVTVARAMHPYMIKNLKDHDGQRHFLTLFHDMAEMYDPADWG
ncbi:hypothetical protein N9917_01335 [Deltaproteobacteria bacterium]|nr:hypothetical protein [Deltaproteobacteria bacterium]